MQIFSNKNNQPINDEKLTKTDRTAMRIQYLKYSKNILFGKSYLIFNQGNYTQVPNYNINFNPDYKSGFI